LADDVRRRFEQTRVTGCLWVPSPPADVVANTDADLPVPERAAAPARPAWRAALGDRVPIGVRGAVVAASRHALVGLALLLAAAVALAAVLLWALRPRTSAVPVVERMTPTAASVGIGPSPTASAAAGPVVVHVAGAVRRPGLVELPGGSRVADAVKAAGGATRRADLNSVNLARPLVDGEQLVVLRRGQAGGVVAAPAGPGGSGAGSTGGAGGTAGGASGPAAAPLNLNTATLDQLETLSGVGPVLAQRIIDWRTEHGRFNSVDELTEVSGIGEATLAEIRPGVRV
jgi:competence protein ComEA